MTLSARVRVSVWYLATLLGLFFVMAQSHAGAAIGIGDESADGERACAIAFAFAAIAVAVLAARPLPTPGPLSRDFEAYWAAGSAWNARADPVRTRDLGRRAQRGRRGRVARGAAPVRRSAGDAARLERCGAAAVRIRRAHLDCDFGDLAARPRRGRCCADAGNARRVSFLAALALAIAFAPISSDLALGQLALPSFLGAVLLCVWRAIARPRSPRSAAASRFAQPNAALGLASRESGATARRWRSRSPRS